MDFRFNVVKKTLLETKSDALILISRVNREWYSNSWSDFGLTIITKSQAHSFVDARDIDTLRKYGNKNAKFYLYTDYQSFVKFVKTLKINSLLIESDHITIDEMNQYVKPLGIRKINSFKSDNLRQAKSPAELILMQKAADIVCAGVNHLKKWVKIGISEKQVARELLKFMINHGATSESFPTIVSFGANAANPHSSPTDRKLKKNELILVDAGCIYNGYCSDMTRVWWIGTPTKSMLKMYNVTLSANLLGIKHARSGVTGQYLDSLCRNYIKENYNNYDIPHGVGHGVGRLIHEEPRTNQANTRPLPIGTVVTIEPGIYDNKIGGVRIEDTIVITKTGCNVLTRKCPK